MSWRLAASAILALVVVGGLAWYERSRPPSRMVALVAALAALAVAGRLAFAPIPNVLATTDIVLLTGYAIGAAPGFAVGALAALGSNMWLGQGPWTPWQMAGWGLVGIGGAVLARATGRRLGRVGLASACGAAGLAYGALLDLSVMVSYGGEQSLDRYLAISARGIPFNVAHAVGNVLLALAAGPALVRMISRYRTRFEFRWAPATGSLAAALVVAVLVSGAGATGGATASDTSATAAGGAASARTWLERRQNGDGGFGASPGASSNPAMTGWAILGLEGAGRNPLDLRSSGRSAVDYLRSHASSLRSTGDLERTVLALEGAGVNPRRFGGRDLVAELRHGRNSNGSFNGQVNLTAFGILALRSAGESRSGLRRSTAWLRGARNQDGGWGFQPDAPSDADSTGAALQGLAVAGNRGNPLRDGVSFLRRTQRGDGGWALSGQGSSNAQSTAWAVQGLVAARARPGGAIAGGRSPFDYLRDRQAGDGHYRYSASSDQTPVWVTSQALLAVRREAFPLDHVPRSSQGGLPPPRTGPPDSASPTAGAGGSPSVGPGSGGSAVSRRQAQGKSDPGVDAGRPGASAAATAGEQPGTPAGEDYGTVASETTSDDGTPAIYIGAALAVLAVGLGAGFFWYRRTLP